MEYKVTYRIVLIRVFLIYLFGLVIYWITLDVKNLLLGTFIGSFLIIWPALLNPREIYLYPTSIKMKLIVFFWLFLFPVSSILLVYSSILSFPESSKLFIEYLRASIIPFILGAIFMSGNSKKVYDILDTQISKESSSFNKGEVNENE
ncbi:hypothetical protein QNH39_26360 [Neobacillus novalis]|uniref:Uncharacterized protein n=1 Tax=Neobacillus novalis TaxID=220687 RepID=A0AA95SB18_9BACI|nr:hypothetical protein [Neobacillus novalis]WHY86054.1 hypothetical protein QNH39_26360 [Neobacillus novalis]